MMTNMLGADVLARAAPGACARCARCQQAALITMTSSACRASNPTPAARVPFWRAFSEKRASQQQLTTRVFVGRWPPPPSLFWVSHRGASGYEEIKAA